MKNKNFTEKSEHDNNPVVPGLVSSVEYLKLNLPPVFWVSFLPFKSVSLSLLSCVHTCIHMCMHVWTCACAYAHCRYVCLCMCVNTHVCSCVCMCLCVHTETSWHPPCFPLSHLFSAVAASRHTLLETSGSP